MPTAKVSSMMAQIGM